MKWLVAPSTFSEGQRAIYGCAVIFAGMFAGVVCLGFIGIFVWSVYGKVLPVALWGQVVTIMGYGFSGFILAMIAVIMTLAVGGPVGRFKGGLSLKDGANLDLGDHESAGFRRPRRRRPRRHYRGE
jgi:hypothetical protein